MVAAVVDERFCPSLGRLKLETLVELCHLSPALLLYGSIQACKLQMGFPQALMQARLHPSNVCGEQTDKRWEAWAKGSLFQTASNTAPLNVVPAAVPESERREKIDQGQVIISQPCPRQGTSSS